MGGVTREELLAILEVFGGERAELFELRFACAVSGVVAARCLEVSEGDAVLLSTHGEKATRHVHVCEHHTNLSCVSAVSVGDLSVEVERLQQRRDRDAGVAVVVSETTFAEGHLEFLGVAVLLSLVCFFEMLERFVDLSNAIEGDPWINFGCDWTSLNRWLRSFGWDALFGFEVDFFPPLGLRGPLFVVTDVASFSLGVEAVDFATFDHDAFFGWWLWCDSWCGFGDLLLDFEAQVPDSISKDTPCSELLVGFFGGLEGVFVVTSLEENFGLTKLLCHHLFGLNIVEPLCDLGVFGVETQRFMEGELSITPLALFVVVDPCLKELLRLLFVDLFFIDRWEQLHVRERAATDQQDGEQESENEPFGGASTCRGE